MSENIIEFVEKYIKETIPRQHTLQHHLDARGFLLELKPDASIESQVAALTHDIERQFGGGVPKPEFFSDENYLVKHGETSADIMVPLLEKQGFDLDFEKLRNIITYHEIGGDEETNLLRDADSISFLKNTADKFIEGLSKEKCLDKFDFMLSRIENEKARVIAQKYYDNAIKLLKEKYG